MNSAKTAGTKGSLNHKVRQCVSTSSRSTFCADLCLRCLCNLSSLRGIIVSSRRVILQLYMTLLAIVLLLILNSRLGLFLGLFWLPRLVLVMSTVLRIFFTRRVYYIIDVALVGRLIAVIVGHCA